MDYPRVSLFHMFYNQLDGVHAAVEASFAQDYPNLEIVFSDDASTDGTFEVLKELVDAYDGPHDVKLMQNAQNKGIVGNFNTLIERTTGDYIVQANGDDVSLPNRVSRIVEVFRSDPKIHQVFSPAIAMTKDGELGRVLYDSPDSSFEVPPSGFLINSVTQTGACSAYDRRIFDRFGPISSHAIYEDRIMTFRARLLGTIRSTKVPLLYFRKGGTSWRSGTDEEKRLFDARMFDTRVGDARAFLEQKSMYQFPGKWRVTLFCHLNIFRKRVLGTPLEMPVRLVTGKTARRIVRGMLVRG